MDAPVWSNDLVYLKETVIIMIVTVLMIAVCFYFTQRAERKRSYRLARARAQTPTASEERAADRS